MAGSPKRYSRGEDDLEFGRVAAFADGVFAIAMTLLTVGITVPVLKNAGSVSELVQALDDLQPEVLSFFLSFMVIGYYWLAHHQFVSQLTSMDAGLVALHLPYLAFIALLPFPTAVLGRYEGNPVALATYAAVVATISAAEWVMFRHARRRGHLRKPMPAPVYRWATVTSLTPSLLFVVSIPLAFWTPTAAYATWLANVPAQTVINRLLRPDDADRYLR